MNFNRANFLLLLLSCVFCLCALEGAVRLRAYLKYGTTTYLGDDRTEVDASTGLRMNRQVAGEHAPQINTLGFRGPEVPLPKPKDVVRVAFLGGSTTYSSELAEEKDTWPYLVIEGLRTKFPDIKFDYVNAAVPGYTTVHSLKNLNQNVAPLKPDILFVYHATNDLARITRRLAQEHGIERISLDVPSFPARFSFLWYLVEKNMRLRSFESQATTGDTRYKTPTRESAKEFEQSAGDLLKRAKEIAPLVVVPTFSYQIRNQQSHAQQLAASEIARMYMPYLGIPQILSGYEQFNEALTKAADQHKALLINDELSIPGDSQHFYDTFHFTKKGSSKMANRVLKAFVGSPQLSALIEKRLKS